MIEKVLKTIKENKLILDSDNIIVGVSGGPDSMALLSVLYELKDNLNFNLYVAHINHGTREGESDIDEEYVRDYCNKLNIKFYSKNVNLKKYSKENKLSEEEAGRVIRYEFFRSIIKKLGKGKIAVAHNKNDQAETFILRLLRGSGIDGLKGMTYLNNDIIRPLLDITRDEIEKYLSENDIEFRIDKTNLLPIYTRNKVRLELIPYLIKNFNKNIIDTLSRTSKLMKIDSDYLNLEASKYFEDILISYKGDKIALCSSKFNSLHLSMKTRILRLGFEKLNGSVKNLEEKHIRSIIKLVSDGKTGKSINITNNIRVYNEYDKFIFMINNNKKQEEFSYILNIDDTTNIKELNILVKTRIIDSSSKILQNKPFIKYFDYDKIIGGIYLRNKRNGDKFVPKGMKGSKKLKDFFIDEKVPREQRDKIPIIHDDKNIIWIVGYRISELYKIDVNTKKVIEIKVLERSNYEQRTN